MPLRYYQQNKPWSLKMMWFQSRHKFLSQHWQCVLHYIYIYISICWSCSSISWPWTPWTSFRYLDQLRCLSLVRSRSSRSSIRSWSKSNQINIFHQNCSINKIYQRNFCTSPSITITPSPSGALPFPLPFLFSSCASAGQKPWILCTVIIAAVEKHGETTNYVYMIYVWETTNCPFHVCWRGYCVMICHDMSCVSPFWCLPRLASPNLPAIHAFLSPGTMRLLSVLLVAIWSSSAERWILRLKEKCRNCVCWKHPKSALPATNCLASPRSSASRSISSCHASGRILGSWWWNWWIHIHFMVQMSTKLVPSCEITDFSQFLLLKSPSLSHPPFRWVQYPRFFVYHQAGFQ